MGSSGLVFLLFVICEKYALFFSRIKAKLSILYTKYALHMVLSGTPVPCLNAGVAYFNLRILDQDVYCTNIQLTGGSQWLIICRIRHFSGVSVNRFAFVTTAFVLSENRVQRKLWFADPGRNRYMGATIKGTDGKLRCKRCDTAPAQIQRFGDDSTLNRPQEC